MSLLRIFISIIIASGSGISHAQVSDVLSFMISSENHEKHDEIPEKADISSILSAISHSEDVKISAVSPLNYISHAYSGCGYHKSGIIGNNGIKSTVPYPGYIGALKGMEWGRITSGFGYRPNFGRMHKGIDVAMNPGDTVFAPLSGRVERVDYEAKGYGRYIVLIHDDGMETRYAHLKMSIVSPGDYVVAGQAIALSGNSGNTTGPHLHFETRYRGEAIDPRTVFYFASGYPVSKPSSIASD